LRARRDVAVQSLRGLAVILMVAGHVVGSDGERGLQVGDDSLWRLLYVGLEDLRMPLFTAISGFVYALRPLVGRGQYSGLVRGKSRRLLVPLVTVGALMFALQLVVPGVNHRPEPADAWRIYLFSFEHLWFLQAIFLIFLLVGLLDVTGRLDRIQSWGVIFSVSCLLHVLLLVPEQANLFSVNGALGLLPFFLLGIGFHRFREVLDLRCWLGWTLPAFTFAYALRLTVELAGIEPAAPVARALSLAVGLAGLTSVFLLRHALTSRALARLGAFSFGVYLLHVFAAAASRIALQRLGVEADPILFVVGLMAGIGLPVLFELTLGRYAIVSRLILGQRPPLRPERRKAVQTPP
jgi:fucose 4-O-acetylase-like acetyltransferase